MSENAPSHDVSIRTPSTRIELQVGERVFATTRETLVRESGYFQSLLSIDGDNTMQNGPYFIDADPDLFDHILRYLRCGVLPVFYDRSKGHNHMLYIALLQEARFFQIKRLEEWIQGEKYLGAVRTIYTMKELTGKTTASKSDSRMLSCNTIHWHMLRKYTYVHVGSKRTEATRMLVADDATRHRASIQTNMYRRRW